MKRKKMLKRFLSFILCFAMLLSAISGAVFADYYEVINDTLTNPTLYGSVYANEKYIFVGEGGSIYYSINATQWTKQPKRMALFHFCVKINRHNIINLCVCLKIKNTNFCQG